MDIIEELIENIKPILTLNYFDGEKYVRVFSDGYIEKLECKENE